MLRQTRIEYLLEEQGHERGAQYKIRATRASLEVRHVSLQ